ncbi:NADH:flavin oxidoreductase/NADH oxidase [Meredithblackwellia eburnea MCA 4105]
MSALFTPIKLGNIEPQHRIVMAPLTRFRADEAHVHQDAAVEYYSQRASTPGTLLITEATFIAPQAGGYAHVPGVWSPEQTAAWKKIVDAVHAKGSFIYLQLWHLGRAASPDVLKKEGFEVVGPSDVPFEGGATPRPLTLDEIKGLPALYAQAAKNFVEGAGGDGVEIHSANGYLVDQFLQTTSNKRTDAYGGSAENRVRLGLEVVDAVTKAVGEEKTGIRISPFSTFQGMKMSYDDIYETFSLYAKSLKSSHPNLAYIHAVEGRVAGNADVAEKEQESLKFLCDIWGTKTMIVAGGFTPESAPKFAEEHPNALVAFGRHFLANPDLPVRIKKGIELNRYNRDTFYLQGPSKTEGYTDYPFAVEVKA